MSALHFRATDPEERDRVRQFLAGVFHLTPDAPAFEPPLIDWKYYQPRPDWIGPRSYVIERKGEIVSHGCVWPMPFVTPSGIVPACQIIDWAAKPSVPGVGMLLRREIEKMVAVAVAIGGSPDSMRVLPGSGYKTVGSFRKFVRVVRPFRQFRRRPKPKNWRALAKLARNTLWSSKPTRSTVGQALGVPASVYARTQRSDDLYQYLLSCPAGNLSAHLVGETGRFLLNEVDGQTRIADLQTDDWPGAVRAATAAAAKIPQTCEIVANVSLDRYADALIQAGYQLRSEQPVFLVDRANALNGAEVHITPIDYDDFFSRFPKSPFAT